MPFFCIHCRSEIDPKYKACPFCGEAITDFLRRYLETPIDGKYKILARLGVGGMGEVYKVLHLHLNAVRVIKLMRASIAGEAGVHERFLREARLATKIHHPNVATLYDFSTLEDGSFYMVWEHIEGINLHEMLAERGPLSPRYATTVAVEALFGLEAIHRAGIVHRDISPENLMIARDEYGEEHVKIIDLGIAKQWSDLGDEKTKTGMFVGKWKYCSPEHLGMLPDGERIDGRADLYSFGIVLYEMLAGVPPFHSETPHGFLMMHASERPKSLREVNPSVTASPELEALLFRSLEKDRTKRFASAREFATALEKILPSLGDVPGAPPPAPSRSEETAEPTRLSAERAAADVETIASAEVATVVTQAGGRDLARTQEMTAAGETPARQPARTPALLVVVLVVIALAVGGYFLSTDEEEPFVVPPKPVAVAPGHVAMNAFPWANVTSIRNLDNGQTVEMKSPMITPQPIDLPPGRYEVTFSNPAYRKAITRTIDVRAGSDATLDVHFADPAKATLPNFGAAR